jgi:hypothetical protein
VVLAMTEFNSYMLATECPDESEQSTVDLLSVPSNHVIDLFAEFDRVQSPDGRQQLASSLCERLAPFMMIEKEMLLAALLRTNNQRDTGAPQSS